jgi:pilus assembly protein CpaF
MDGPSLSISRFGKERYDTSALVAQGALTPEIASFFEVIVKARLNLLVCGATGSGKTTLLNCLSGFIPSQERIVTIEDSAELSLRHPHVVRLETRPAGLDGTGEVTLRDLLKNCLRMRPDRIIVDELRGAEVLDLLQAMLAGHDGALAAIHADSARESLARLETMMLLAGFSLPQRAIRHQIAAAINIVVHLARLSDGSRKAMCVSEISGIDTDSIIIRDLFEFVPTGTTAEGQVAGHFRPTGIRSAYADQLEAAGFKLDPIKPQPYANAR